MRMIALLLIAASSFAATTVGPITSAGWQLKRGSTNVGTPHTTKEACWSAGRADAEARDASANYSCVLTEKARITWTADPPTEPPQTGSMMPAVNVALIPPRNTSAHVGPVIATTGQMPGRAGDGVGAFRTNCGYSHFNFDDPLIFPGVQNATHLHVYWGNTLADFRSTPASMASTGNSTCTGGTLNRTAYWAPAVIDTRTGRPQTPLPLSIYYKVGYNGLPNAAIRPFPSGLRMIAGNSKATTPQSGQISNFYCHSSSFSSGPMATIPAVCPAGANLVQEVAFPQCWDGVNLDSPDHKSHMTYPSGNACPASHPVPIPHVIYEINYRVTEANATQFWRLSSDINGTPAGSTSHADWFSAWDNSIVATWVTRVLNPGLDGQTYMLGDGRVLGGQP
jgi:Domain of unknown function (DUF1996)